MSMRAQISLQFDDADLYENFIVPYKEERILNSLIIKCLSAYYYNNDVRTLIEGTSIDEVTENTGFRSTQEICDSIRTSLMMQDFLTVELQSTIDNGTEDVKNILNKTNDFAVKSGVAKPSESEYGEGVFQIEMKNQSLEKKEEGIVVPQKPLSEDSTFKLLFQMIGKIAEATGNSEVMQMLSSSSESEQSVEPQVEEKNEIQTPIVEVSTVENIPSEKTEEVVQDTQSDNEDVDFSEVITEDTFKPDEPDESEDASAALQDLMASLG